MFSYTGGGMKDTICITAVIVIVVISVIPTTFSQEECPWGAEFIISFDEL